MRINLFLVLALIGIALVFYLSWLPQPELGLNWFIPTWLATWTDARSNDTIRTGVPFIFLGVLTGVWLLSPGYNWYHWLASWLLLILIVIIAEAGQLFLPNRAFDLKDIAWGAIGAAVGLAVPILSTIIRNSLYRLLERE